MDILDIAPISYLSEFYKIPGQVIIFIILVAGYFTVRLAQNRDALNRDKMQSIDTIFLIATTGTTWFLRIALLTFWILALKDDTDVITRLEGIPLLYVYGLGAYIILSSIIDIKAILNRRLFPHKELHMTRFQWWNNLKIWDRNHRFAIVILLTTGWALFLSLGFFYYAPQGIDYLLFALFYFLMAFFTVTPMIAMQFWVMKRLLSSTDGTQPNSI